MLFRSGRVIAYTILGFIIIPFLKQGSSIYMVHKLLARFGEYAIAPAMIFIGLFMLLGHKLNFKQWSFLNIDGTRFKEKGSLGALLLGFLFALAFCPTSGVIYFGMLMPMSASQAEGYLLPVAKLILSHLYWFTIVGSSRSFPWSSRLIVYFFMLFSHFRWRCASCFGLFNFQIGRAHV